MLKVVDVEIGLHLDPLPPKALVVLRAGERRQVEELYYIEREFFLYDRDIASDRLGRVRGKPRI